MHYFLDNNVYNSPDLPLNRNISGTTDVLLHCNTSPYCCTRVESQQLIRSEKFELKCLTVPREKEQKQQIIFVYYVG